MKILGIDYGRKKIGVAVSEGMVAEPLVVIRFNNEEEGLEKVAKVVKVEQIERVVVGISEGKMAEESKKFSLSLKELVKIPVEIFDETLSTQRAQELSIEAGIKRKKRKEMEDSYAAAVMLQGYLEK